MEPYKAWNSGRCPEISSRASPLSSSQPEGNAHEGMHHLVPRRGCRWIRTHDSITSRNPGMANWKVRGQKLR